MPIDDWKNRSGVFSSIVNPSLRSDQSAIGNSITTWPSVEMSSEGRSFSLLKAFTRAASGERRAGERKGAPSMKPLLMAIVVGVAWITDAGGASRKGLVSADIECT
ncbi:MAG: hypothetical protein ACLQOO_07105 [Terriglobia bacterium]